MRPDGKWALAEVNNQLWVAAVPPFTGSAASVSVRSPSLPVKRLTDIGSDYFAWADGGKTITWAIGSTFFRRSFDTIDFGRGALASTKLRDPFYRGDQKCGISRGRLHHAVPAGLDGPFGDEIRDSRRCEKRPTLLAERRRVLRVNQIFCGHRRDSSVATAAQVLRPPPTSQESLGGVD